VLLTEQAFSPTLEAYTPSPDRNGILPSQRWTTFPKRHNEGGTLVFIDGHSSWFKWKYVVKTTAGGAVDNSTRVEIFNADVWWNPNRDL
jgi:prepilin-type processing-associated H-X9-DG protein